MTKIIINEVKETIKIVSSGQNGDDGLNGKSAYEIALDNGFVGTEQEWLLSLKGNDGEDGLNGKSAYEIALDNGFIGTEQEWISSLNGTDGQGVAVGGKIGQVLVKKSDNDFDTEWKDNNSSSNIYEIFRYFTFLSSNTAIVNNQSNNSGLGTTSFSTSGQGVLLNNNIFGFTNIKQNYFQNPSTPNSLILNFLTFDPNSSAYPNQNTKHIFEFGFSTKNDLNSKTLIGFCNEFVGVPQNNNIESMINVLGVGFDTNDQIYHLFINKNNEKVKIPITEFIGNLTADDIKAREINIRYRVSFELINNTNLTCIFENCINGNKATYIYNNSQNVLNNDKYMKPMFWHKNGLLYPEINLIDRLHVFNIKKYSNDF